VVIDNLANCRAVDAPSILKRLLPDEKYILDHDENQYFDMKNRQKIMMNSAKEVAKMAGT
jgi:hypothetical protein